MAGSSLNLGDRFVSLTAATQVINYAIVTFTYLRFYYVPFFSHLWVQTDADSFFRP